MSYDRKDVYRLAAETGADVRTVTKWLDGEKVVGVADYALRTAAEKLEIPIPPARKSEDVA